LRPRSRHLPKFEKPTSEIFETDAQPDNKVWDERGVNIRSLIDQILLDSNVPLQHQFDEPVRGACCSRSILNNFILFNDENHAGRNRGSMLEGAV
jgi:hypothetical protein